MVYLPDAFTSGHVESRKDGFVEVDAKSVDELEKILEDEEVFESFFKSLKCCRKMQKVFAELEEGNITLARTLFQKLKHEAFNCREKYECL